VIYYESRTNRNLHYEGEAPVSTTDLDKPDIGDPTLDAENALSAKLIKLVLWCGGGLFMIWIGVIALFF
jgi:hypothetical protein